MYITGGQDEIRTLPGSATLIDRMSLEQCYTVSSLDNMQWDHTQFQLTHVFEPTFTSMVTTDVYRNEFSRDRFKLNGFSGELASSGTADRLMIGNNGRDFISQGIQSKLNMDAFVFGLLSDLHAHAAFGHEFRH